MMAEAKKMMENPEWQKKMKAFTGDAEMKEKFKSIGEDMKDAGKRAKLEAKMEAMVKLGNEQLTNQAGKTMEDAMASMNDPKVMAEMVRTVQDPKFKENFAKMAADPTFKKYIDAMGEMMKDPAQKKKLEAVKNAYARGEAMA